MNHENIKVGMLILMTHDIEASVQFYRDKLGLKLNFYLKNEWAEFSLGCVKFGLCPKKNDINLDENKLNVIRTGIVLEVINQDIIEFYKKLKAQAVEFYNQPVEAPHGIMISLKDPSGNILDLYQPNPEKLKKFIVENKDK